MYLAFNTQKLQTVSILAICASLIGACPTSQTSSVVVGYRVVKKETGDKYIEAGTLVYVEANKKQIGDGAYTSPTINAWNPEDEFYECVIRADAAKWDAIDKIWIPKYNPKGGEGLWFEEDELDNYVKSNNLDVETTIRLSRIADLPHGQQKLQLLLPTGVIAESKDKAPKHDLGLTVECVKIEDRGKLPQETVDYEELKKVHGEVDDDEDFVPSSVQWSMLSALCSMPSRLLAKMSYGSAYA
ncbi:hypothetical protein DL96DRAFT_1713564 [Flagelloscypha sp. PMI_526]|nr:hypothetical protein DL96DRAFT_1713564 [Flagelloscypha sp. PMI_526]